MSTDEDTAVDGPGISPGRSPITSPNFLSTRGFGLAASARTPAKRCRIGSPQSTQLRMRWWLNRPHCCTRREVGTSACGSRSRQAPPRTSKEADTGNWVEIARHVPSPGYFRLNSSSQLRNTKGRREGVRDKLREGLTTLLHRLIRNKKPRSRAASSEKIPPRRVRG